METRGVGRGGWTLLLAASLYVSLLSIWPLFSHWAADPQYHYGFLVPILAIVLAIRRWISRPDPGPRSCGIGTLLVLLLILFLPASLLLQPNPDWRLLNWVSTGLCVLSLLGIAALLGGPGWVRHFAFPAVFLFAGVPWPTEIEWPVTQGLMRAVAATAAEVLSIAGVPAIAQGNLVEIANGTLGVDLACSGIRSLQPSLMMALFLGELFHFDLSRRIALFLAGFAIAFLTNLGRVLILAGVASSQGFAAVDRWHDPAGGVLMTICFALVYGTALLLAPNQRTPVLNEEPSSANLPSIRWPIVALLWIGFSITATEIWYRSKPDPRPVPWSFTAPPGSEPLALDAEAAAMLNFDRGGGWKWKTGGAPEWIAYDLIWDPGPTRSRMLLSMHRPDICLAAVGLRLLDDRGVITANAHGHAIPFQAYIFSSPKGPLHVYYALYRAGEPVLERESSVRNACFRAVAERRRSLDQRVLQLAVSGYPDTREADQALFRILADTILPKPGSPRPAD